MNEVIKKCFGERVNRVNVEFSIILHTKLIIIIIVVTPLIIRSSR